MLRPTARNKTLMSEVLPALDSSPAMSASRSERFGSIRKQPRLDLLAQSDSLRCQFLEFFRRSNANTECARQRDKLADRF